MQNQPPANRLLNDSLRIPVEQVVSKHIGRTWNVKIFRDMNEFASHHCAILSDGSYSVFAKLSQAAHGLEQFEAELDGLRFLSEHSGALIPSPVGNVPVDGGVIMVMEEAQAVERTSRQWREIGQALARIHRIKGDRCGLEKQGYFGPLYQDNRPIQDWPTFYAERRLWPRLIGAIDSGHMPTRTIRQVEKLIQRLPGLCGPEIIPSLLHGDAQQNNFISTELGAVVIDPAVYYGSPEIDLAFVDYFQSVSDDVFLGYQEELPIDPGFWERRDLWRVYGWLAAVTVEGAAYVGKLTDAVQKYL